MGRSIASQASLMTRAVFEADVDWDENLYDARGGLYGAEDAPRLPSTTFADDSAECAMRSVTKSRDGMSIPASGLERTDIASESTDGTDGWYASSSVEAAEETSRRRRECGSVPVSCEKALHATVPSSSKILGVSSRPVDCGDLPTRRLKSESFHESGRPTSPLTLTGSSTKIPRNTRSAITRKSTCLSCSSIMAWGSVATVPEALKSCSGNFSALGPTDSSDRSTSLT